MMRLRALAAASVALAAGLALAACQPTPSAPTPTQTPIESPKPTPTPTETAVAEDDILFVVTATVTSPDADTATFMEKVHAPVDATEISAATAAQLTTDCGDVASAYPDPRYLVADVEATEGGSGDWTSAVGVDLGGSDGDHPSAPVTWAGDFDTFQAFCATVTAKVPGTITGTAVVSPDASEDTGWMSLRYGFGTTTAGWTVSDCSLEVGAAGLAQAPEIQSWTPIDTGEAGTSCFFGG